MVKSAILIDGGYFLKRLPVVRPDIDSNDPKAVAGSVRQLVRSHLEQLNDTYTTPNALQLLYRAFYYDARPYDMKAHKPVSGSAIDYARTDQARFRWQLFGALRHSPNLAVRLGEVRRDSNRAWILNAEPQKALLNGQRVVSDLIDEDFSPALRQKGVDMRIGLDIASLTLKRHADIIVLVSGDADFVPAAKFARREGVRFVLDPLWQDIPADLHEHIDGLTSGFPRPRRDTGRSENA